MLELKETSRIKKSFVDGFYCLRYEARVELKNETWIITIHQTEKKGLNVYFDNVSAFGKVRDCAIAIKNSAKIPIKDKLLRAINNKIKTNYQDIEFINSFCRT